MEPRRFLLTVFVCAALAGCASMQTARSGGSETDPCRGNQAAICQVVVNVVGCSSSQISAIPEKVYVAKDSNPTMQWKLSPMSLMLGWRFATPDVGTGVNGIVFKTAAGQQEIMRRGNSQTVVTFTNNHRLQNRTEHEYGINIVRLGSTPGSIVQTCPQKDPWVVNL